MQLEMQLLKTKLKLMPIALITATLIACGGGGGGGGVSNVSPTPIHVTVAAVDFKPTGAAKSGTAPTTIVAVGLAPTGAAKFGTAPTPDAVVAAANSGSAVAAGLAGGLAGLAVSFPLNFNNATNTGVTGAISIDPTFTLSTTGATVTGGITNLTAIGINTVNATTTGNSLSFNSADPANVFTNNGVSSASGHIINPTNTSYYDILLISLVPSGLSYTSFGDWSQCSANCTVNGGTTAVNGVYVWGSATAPGNIPTTGSAIYGGQFDGDYISPTGAKTSVSGTQGTSGGMTAIVNFATRNIAFSTSGTTGGPNLDMFGNLTYAAGQNLFVGTVNSATMKGTASGRFFGPNVEEIGGVYSLSGGSAGHYGIFFGKK